MISFDLKCSSGHVFEAWFQSSTSFEDQRQRDLIACPVCSDTSVEKAPMAPNIPAKANRAVVASAQPTKPTADQNAQAEQFKAALRALATAQAEALGSSTWVGKDFAKTARSMHQGEVDTVPIHGQATAEDARALVEEGIDVLPLLVPVVPPERRN